MLTERERRETEELVNKNRDNFFSSISALIKQFSQADLNKLREITFNEVKNRRIKK